MKKIYLVKILLIFLSVFLIAFIQISCAEFMKDYEYRPHIDFEESF